MSFRETDTPDRDLGFLINQVVDKYLGYIDSDHVRWLLVDAAAQRLVLIRGRTPLQAWPVSTAATGLDNRQDSNGTPPGIHRIDRKIGEGCPPGAIFESRRFTERIHDPESGAEPDTDLILTRILTLVGLEQDINVGQGVDSRERFIYLHGTNDEARIGQPVSHGCVRLTNADIMTVFDLVSEGDPVVII